MRPLLEWLGCVTGTFLVAAVPGAWANREALRTWYPRLRKPALTPPPAVFPIIWAVLYLLMATALWSVLQHRHDAFVRGYVGSAVVAYGVQLLLNAAWSLFFFKFRLVRLAVLDGVLLCGAIVATIVLFRFIVPWTQWLLLPYLAWACFASYLTRAFARLNVEFFQNSAEPREDRYFSNNARSRG